MRNRSPYLVQHRLADLIAAIQVLGTYKFASRDPEKWEQSLGRKPLSAESWHRVFEEHPEFFRIKGADKKASLMWRRSYEKIFDTRAGKELTSDQIADLDKDEKKQFLSRAPVTASQVETLIHAAIELHTRAIAQRQEMRWWIPVLTAFLGVIIGALIKAFLR